jgi:transposase InsO family protein
MSPLFSRLSCPIWFDDVHSKSWQLLTDASGLSIQAISAASIPPATANAKFHARAAESKICLSMSSTGNCYDSAPAESFVATVKLGAMPDAIFASRQQARRALFDYIEVFYNRQRLRSGIHYARPVSRAA